MNSVRCFLRTWGMAVTSVPVLAFMVIAPLLVGSSQSVVAEIAPQQGDYRSAVDEGVTGNWDVATSWEVCRKVFVDEDGEGEIVVDDNGEVIIPENWVDDVPIDWVSMNKWIPADTYPGQPPVSPETENTYSVTIQSGDVINAPAGSLYFGDLMVYGQLNLYNNLTLATTDYVLVDGDYYDESNITTGGSIRWLKKLELHLEPQYAAIKIVNIRHKSGEFAGEVIEGLGLYTLSSGNNNMRLIIGDVDYAAATGGGNVEYTFDDINEAGGSLAAVATATPEHIYYIGNATEFKTILEGGVIGLGSNTITSYYWTGTGPDDFDFSSNEQNPGQVNLVNSWYGTYIFTFTVTSNYLGFIYENSQAVIVTVHRADLTITALDQTKEGDDATFTLDQTKFNVTGLKDGDTVSSVTLTSDGTAPYVETGTYIIEFNEKETDGTHLENYNITYENGTLKVIRPLTVTGIIGIDKGYDGTLAAGVDCASATLVGVINGDNVSLDCSGVTATFEDENVGTGKTVTLTGATLTGDDAANYSLDSAPTTTANITPLHITGTSTADNKVYDGNNSATITETGLVDEVSGDDVSLDCSGATATFEDENVGTGKTVTIASATLTGDDAANYLLDSVATTTASITPLHITGNFTADSKVFDGNDSATVAGVYLVGEVSGDDVSLAGGTATFEDENVGTGKTVTLIGATLTGDDAGNYTLIQPTTTADITPLTIYVSVDDQSKTHGDPDPEMTYTYSPELISNDIFTGELARNPGEGVGTYAISQGTLTLSDNYILDYTGADLTIMLIHADFKVSNLVITTSNDETWGGITFMRETNKIVVVTVDVTNTGGQSGTYQGILNLNGKNISSENITLEPGESGQVTFNVAGLHPGDYNVEVEDLSGEFSRDEWTNWWLISNLILTVVFVGYLIKRYTFRKNSRSEI